jgi:hypothetical protein
LVKYDVLVRGQSFDDVAKGDRTAVRSRPAFWHLLYVLNNPVVTVSELRL